MISSETNGEENEPAAQQKKMSQLLFLYLVQNCVPCSLKDQRVCVISQWFLRELLSVAYSRARVSFPSETRTSFFRKLLVNANTSNEEENNSLQSNLAPNSSLSFHLGNIRCMDSQTKVRPGVAYCTQTSVVGSSNRQGYM